MTPSKFLGLLFQSRDTMHLTHLDTRSFAEHKALNAYYDGILDLTDSSIFPLLILSGLCFLSLLSLIIYIFIDKKF